MAVVVQVSLVVKSLQVDSLASLQAACWEAAANPRVDREAMAAKPEALGALEASYLWLGGYLVDNMEERAESRLEARLVVVTVVRLPVVTAAQLLVVMEDRLLVDMVARLLVFTVFQHPVPMAVRLQVAMVAR